MKQVLCYALALGLTAAPVTAQDASEEDAGGLLVDFLEDTLSSDSRYISVSGVDGAFSSEAKIRKITVADEDGIWLTIEGAVLDWNRLDLLRGRFSVNELSAERIEIARAPEPLPPDPELPAAETTPFALPELPVAIELGQIKAARIELGEALAGTAASLRVEGSLKLADGALDTKLEAARLDKPSDHIRLSAAYANETQLITLDLSADEAAGGLISRGLDLPGNPELQLTAKGSGPVTDFTAAISFSTNGTERLGGQVVLAARPLPQDVAPETARDIGFSADLGGNIDVLLPPVHRPFFGPGLRLNVKGLREGSGAVTLDTLVLRTNALRITGAAGLSADGKLATANLKSAITPPAGQAAVTLPTSDGQTTLAKADLQLQKTLDGRWVLDGVLNQLSHPGALVDTAEISGRGTLDQSSGFALEGRLKAGLSGFQPRNPALAKATGNEIRFEGTLSTDGPGALHITDMELRGSDYRAAGDLAFDGLEEGLKVSGDLTARASDLSRFSDLAGRPIGGVVQAQVRGAFSPLTGGFDTDLSVQTRDLSAGIAQADELLAGTTTLALKAARDENGIAIDHFDLAGSALKAAATGTLNNQAGKLNITARLNRLEVLVPQAPGTLELATTLSRTGDTFSGVAELTGPHTSAAKLTGSVTLAGQADISFQAMLSELERFVPELAGKLQTQGTATRRAGEWQIDGEAAGPAGIDARLAGRISEDDGSADLRFDAEMAELQRLLPDLPGRLAATGTAARRAGIWTVDSTASGPAGIDSRIQGSWDETQGTADATAKGTLRLEGLNPFLSPNLLQGRANFDMSLRGTLALDSVSGTISVPGATLAIPAAAQRVDDINATVSIARSAAQIQVSARPRDGGTVRISGPLGLLPPFNSNLQIAIGDVVVTDHLSYETLLNGSLAMSGAMAGNNRLTGQINVGETNINLNTAGGSVSSAPIPPIRHKGAPRGVRRTQARAGLTASSSGSAGGSGRTDLDIMISAPSRIFARGRGLRSELGGQIHLRGTTARPSPAGQISLIRGTFDVLGRRLELDEGRITLLGDLKPYLEFKSTAATEQGTATLEISGQVDAPEIKVSSDPPRPSEEALALLLFGDNIGDISPLALARLAGSALTLSGRGNSAQNKLRQATGADDVDIGTDNLGAGQLGLGGYVAENVYTDFNVNTQGDSELSINLDVTKSLTVQGTVDSEGETGVGLFFKRDY
ncbi:hypothetical protein AB838_01555 [Rhodobacteraceae bacterium (ex Bugula neritina AB1)]|nr:hypothetical protein AB838_01555 [Rhodobacteraceae bacterium (ex Bugula neritina AB1)]